MKKQSAIIKAYWQRALTYRFEVMMYRVGEMGEMIALILMWTAIYGDQELIRGFSIREMITYILIGNLFNAMIRNFLTGIVSADIKEGRLSAFLLMPISYFQFVISREIGRISVATFMSVISQSLIIMLFFGSFIINADGLYLLMILIMVILAFFTELLLSYLIGLSAFWFDDVDGLHSTVGRVQKFFSGGYFPLSLLPAGFVGVSYFLPFAYSFFVPAQLYLKKIDLVAGAKGIGVQMIWILILYGISIFMWKRGLKRYEGVGI